LAMPAPAPVVPAAILPLVVHPLLLLLILLTAAGAGWIARGAYLSRKIDALVSAAKRLGTGDLATRVEVLGREGALGRAARALDEMAASLEQYYSGEQLVQTVRAKEAEIARQAGQLEALQRELEEARAGRTTEAEQLAQAREQVEAQVRDRKRAEEALRKSEGQLHAILDNSAAVISVKDARGRYILVNRSFETLFHLSRQQVTGLTDHDLFPQEMADAFRANDEKVLAAGVPLEIEERALHDDGV